MQVADALHDSRRIDVLGVDDRHAVRLRQGSQVDMSGEGAGLVCGHREHRHHLSVAVEQHRQRGRSFVHRADECHPPARRVAGVCGCGA